MGSREMSGKDPWEMDWGTSIAPQAAAPSGGQNPWEMDWGEPKAGVLEDVAKSGGIGLAKGTIGLAGLPGDVALKLNQGIDYLTEKAGLGVAPSRPVGTSAQIQHAVEGVTGEFRKPQTTAGKYAETIGEFVPGAMVGPGGIARKVIAGAVAPAVASEAAGQAVGEGSPYEPYARFAGAIAGGVAPAAATRAITPLPFRGAAASGAEHAAAVAHLEQEGVPVTAGQSTDRSRLKYLEGDLSPELNTQQQEAFTRAALRRVGVDAPLATTGPHGTVTLALDRIGGDFDRLSNRNTLTIDGQLIADLQNTHNAYTRTPGLFNQETVGAVTGVTNRILDAMMHHSGQLSGEEYQTLRSDLSRAGRGATDPQRAGAINDVLGHLDDAMERSIAHTNPQDSGAWGQARRDYRNILVLERAVTSEGQGAARGYISPAQLASAAKTIYGRRAYMRGVDDFSDLAQSGVSVMKPLPDSGTSQRARVDQYIGHATRALGGLGGMVLGGTHGMEAGVGGLLAGELAGHLAEPVVRAGLRGAVMSPLAQAYLSNQAMAGPNRALQLPAGERLARALVQTMPQLSGGPMGREPLRITVSKSRNEVGDQNQ
jgi:hypothetical protein